MEDARSFVACGSDFRCPCAIPPPPVSRPIAVELPAHGVFFAESVHDVGFEMPWRRDPFHKLVHLIRGTALLRTVALQVLVQLARLPAGGGGGAAAAAHMSRRSFSAHFHRRTGRTFLAHLTALRLEHAARLLAQGNHSIVGAALAAGYRDVSPFHRLWRRHYGTTPKAWARGR